MCRRKNTHKSSDFRKDVKTKYEKPCYIYRNQAKNIKLKM